MFEAAGAINNRIRPPKSCLKNTTAVHNIFKEMGIRLTKTHTCLQNKRHEYSVKKLKLVNWKNFAKIMLCATEGEEMGNRMAGVKGEGVAVRGSDVLIRGTEEEPGRRNYLGRSWWKFFQNGIRKKDFIDPRNTTHLKQNKEQQMRLHHIRVKLQNTKDKRNLREAWEKKDRLQRAQSKNGMLAA